MKCIQRPDHRNKDIQEKLNNSDISEIEDCQNNWRHMYKDKYKKGKAIPVIGREGP
jgi:hypothetical protein